MFFNSGKLFPFRGPIKYFESALPELGRSGDGKQFFKSSLKRLFDLFLMEMVEN